MLIIQPVKQSFLYLYMLSLFSVPFINFLSSAVVAGCMVIAGLLHPQEFWDLASGLLYFLTIPSGYLLLTIFMLTNMHNVSWGKQ